MIYPTNWFQYNNIVHLYSNSNELQKLLNYNLEIYSVSHLFNTIINNDVSNFKYQNLFH